MKYKILSEDTSVPLLKRLLRIREIECDVEEFLNPTFAHYRKDPFLLSDMEKAIERIFEAIKKKERIMIFGDYDVDGITSSRTLYIFITKHLGYKNISIMFPHRRHDGYGLKNKHVDIMKEKKVDLIITVDNGITSIGEADYATEQGIDLIITDHHHASDIIPNCIAVVNPQTSPDYYFKGICGAGVAFKMVVAMMSKTDRTDAKRRQIFSFFLPIIAIATVADVVPLQDENRMIVKKGLEYINSGQMPPSLAGMIKFLKIKGPVESYHIGFVIGPRINAGGRVATPQHSLETLLHTGDRQTEKLQELEDLNLHRRTIQETALKDAKKQIKPDQSILIAHSPDYHEGIVGIVAGRITQKHNKPSLIMYTNEETGTSSGSLRCPTYFNIITMLHHETVTPLLLRFGGHKQAGGLTVKTTDIPKLIEALEKYTNDVIEPHLLEKEVLIDTVITPEDLDEDKLIEIQHLAPFGQGNPEPVFIFKDVTLNSTLSIGKKKKKHLKCEVQHGDHTLTAMYRGKGELADTLSTVVDIVGKVQPDTYKGGRMVIIDEIIEKNPSS